MKIYDSSALSSLSNEFSSIKKTIYKIFGVEDKYELIKVNKHTKVLYDLFAIGKDTGELKRQFLHSLIITYIFENENCTIEEMVKGLASSLNHGKNLDLILQSQIDSLRAKGTIVNGKEKLQLDLALDKRRDIQELLNTSIVQEGILKNQLDECLSKFHLTHETKTIVEFVYKSFQANYEADLEELSRGGNHSSSAIKKIYAALIKFLSGKLKDQKLAENVSREILTICTSSEYLNKISASILFTKLFQSDKLEAYINQRTQLLFLDTQILLRIICLDISKSKKDVSMKSVDDFMSVVKKHKKRIILKTSHDYILELTKQIRDALGLERFFKLPVIQKFGGQTNNVIYNYFKSLVDNGLYDKDLTIGDFVSEILDIDLPAFSSKEFTQVASIQIEKIFAFLDIEIVYMGFHDDFVGIKKEFETALFDRTKSLRAIEHDVNTIIYLSDAEEHFDEGTQSINEPFLITWDKSFYPARKRILERYLHRGYWYIYTPSKYANRLSLQNFQLNPSSINNNIVSLTESNFNNSSKTSFIDIMSSLFNVDDLSDMKIATRLVELEAQTKPLIEDAPNEEEDVHEDSPLIKVLQELRSHYLKKETKYTIDELVFIFENTLLADNVYQVIYENVEAYKTKKNIEPDLFDKFDGLIKSGLTQATVKEN